MSEEPQEQPPQARRNVALITGITGQDGSYLAELLLSKGYQVHGVLRRASTFNTGRVQHLYADRHAHRGGAMRLHYGDMTDSGSLAKILAKVAPTEVYNLAAQSHVKVSFELAEYTADVDAVGALRLLDAIRTCGMEKSVRFYQASTSELYGRVAEVPQNEKTPFAPRSPYACAKLYAHWIVSNYREAYGMYACNGVLFNHESPRRGETFVTRKVTRAVAKIALGLSEHVELGNLDARRDWGHASDYVKAMWLMLQQDQPDDFVVATGESYSVRDFVEEAFRCVGRAIKWRGAGVDEVGFEADTGAVRIRVSADYFRPTEVDLLLGDSSKARRLLGWQPRVAFKELVRDMVDADMRLMKADPSA